MISDVIKLLIEVTNKLLDKTPNYSQRRYAEYLEVKKRYEYEKSKDYPDRDDNKLVMYRRDLLQFISEINSSIS